MQLPAGAFTVTDWSGVEGVVHAGELGQAVWHTVQRDELRVRIVEYSPGWVSDHFCPRGHVLLVLEGELVIRLADGSEHTLRAGMGFQTGDDPANPHSSRSQHGARAFIVD